jgi:hypothetical protein
MPEEGGAEAVFFLSERGFSWKGRTRLPWKASCGQAGAAAKEQRPALEEAAIWA